MRNTAVILTSPFSKPLLHVQIPDSWSLLSTALPFVSAMTTGRLVWKLMARNLAQQNSSAMAYTSLVDSAEDLGLNWTISSNLTIISRLNSRLGANSEGNQRTIHKSQCRKAILKLQVTYSECISHGVCIAQALHRSNQLKALQATVYPFHSSKHELQSYR